MIVSYAALKAFLKHLKGLYKQPSKAKYSFQLQGLLDESVQMSVVSHYRALRTEVRQNMASLPSADRSTYIAEALAELEQSKLSPLIQRATQLRTELTASLPVRLQPKRVQEEAEMQLLTLGMFLNEHMRADAKRVCDEAGSLVLLTSKADRYLNKVSRMLRQVAESGREEVLVPRELLGENAKARQLEQIHQNVFVPNFNAAMCEQVEQSLQLVKKAQGTRGFAGVVRALVDALVEEQCTFPYVTKPQVVEYFAVKYDRPTLKEYPDKLQESRHSALLRTARAAIKDIRK
ncbi:hypothetical protein [Hymenobacter sp. CRA2]|uniref:hypothetical protein n=1 Tax=Hymenobacter sp. CRA2 TaxID=1955620 RepID=UPI00098ECD04|nr:hypothetical protein [Hymenobacter sp. CRA2]OON66246.1 hypothetical protein B0919_22435 [Hymenobacter sp. CRA2]